MPEIPPPHPYIPAGPLESAPAGGYQPAGVRREAFAAVLDGVRLGAYHNRIIEWLVQLDDDTCRTLASVMWRCRLTAPPETGTVTEWGVRYTRPADAPSGAAAEVRVDRGADRETAERMISGCPHRDKHGDDTLVYREVGPWKEAGDGEG